MADFTDDADRQLVQLAAELSAGGRMIPWSCLAARMKRCPHSKEALQQRLKTLKRTHGSDVRAFPLWYFREARGGGGGSSAGAAGGRPSRPKSESALPSKRLLPPLERVCGRYAPTRRRLLESDECGDWRSARWTFGVSCEDDRERVMLPPLQSQSAAAVRLISPAHCIYNTAASERTSGASSSLELLASVAAQAPAAAAQHS